MPSFFSDNIFTCFVRPCNSSCNFKKLISQILILEKSEVEKSSDIDIETIYEEEF